MAIQTGNFPRLNLGGMLTLFGAHYDQFDAVHPKVYKIKNSDQKVEEALQLDGLSQATHKAEGASMETDSMSQGFARLTSHKVWHKRCAISMEADADNLHVKQASEIPKHLARSLFHAKETNAAALFNNLTSTSAPYLGGDGDAFLSTSHALHGTSGETYSNLVASDISELALENAIIQMGYWKDSAGNLLVAKPKMLLLPIDQKFAVTRILQSDLQAGSANNDINALRALNAIPSVQYWNFMSDTDSWVILTSIEGLVHYKRMAPSLDYHQDKDNYDHIYSMMERYSFDYTDARCAIGAAGA